MKPALLVATSGWDPEGWARRFRLLLPERVVLSTAKSGTFDGPEGALAEVHYLLAWKPAQEIVACLPKLRVIFSLGAGVDHIFALESLPDVPIVRIVDTNLTARMAEYVAWQALHHLRRGSAYRVQQTEHVWREIDHPTASDVTVGLMGFGVLGAAAASVLGPLGFRLRGWSRSPRSAPGVEMFAGRDDLEPFLAGTDILVSLLPLTPETRGLIDLKLLRKLRRSNALGGAILINAGRGGSQIEGDIVAALKDGTLAGASLDVFEAEPLSTDSPLWDFSNVVITPHVAATSDPDALASGIAEQIHAYERGEDLKNRVSRERGY